MGLAFAAHDGLLTCDKQGCCISLQHANQERGRETAFLTPLAIPACTGAARNKARVTDGRSHLIPPIHTAPWEVSLLLCSILDFLLAVVFAVYLVITCPACWNDFFFALSHRLMDEHWLRFSIWLLRAIIGTTARLLTSVKRVMTHLCSEIFFFQFPRHQIFALVFICNASSSCDSIRKSRYSVSASDISIIFPISAQQHRVRKTKCLCTILFSKRLKTRNECKNPRRLSLNDRSAPLLSATPSATRDDRRRRNEILQRRKSGEALP